MRRRRLQPWFDRTSIYRLPSTFLGFIFAHQCTVSEWIAQREQRGSAKRQDLHRRSDQRVTRAHTHNVRTEYNCRAAAEYYSGPKPQEVDGRFGGTAVTLYFRHAASHSPSHLFTAGTFTYHNRLTCHSSSYRLCYYVLVR